VIKISQGSEVT